MRILYLYSELGPYNVPVLRTLAEEHGAIVDVISWDKKRLKPYEPPVIPGVSHLRRSEMSPDSIRRFAVETKPDLVYISGWMDRGYFPAASALRRRGVPVVTGFDDQWTGTMRQRIGVLVYRAYLSRYYSHAWVAGVRQYEFARRLGFRDGNIIYDLLTADVALFETATAPAAKRPNYPKVFLYAGNFRLVKGTDILASAYTIYREKWKGDWTLLCAGNGELANLLSGRPGVTMLGFASQEELVRQCQAVGAFVLPSRHDQWGVVVHEFAAAGLPLLLSKSVGARSHFLIDGFNGLSYADNTPEALAEAMWKMSSQSEDALRKMGEASRQLSLRISPRTSVSNFLSVPRTSG